MPESEKRPTQYSPNEIAARKSNSFLKLCAYFRGPIPRMIEAAAILSRVVRRWLDSFVIRILLSVNAVVGLREEHQATKSPLLNNKSSDRTLQIAARAYERYQKRIRGQSQQYQGWLETERSVDTW
jgi:magnesium-transporting ATPase (P-type)